ncbi:MAG: hypothetical protein U9N48_00130 [Euryarchaeota archaeon]|nr:hypothetical protein [Euryarchaeota archaeon]
MMAGKCLVAVFCLAVLGAAVAQPVIHIGSKSDPNASLFSYDQKFGETTSLRNYDVGMSAYKNFDECTRLSSSAYLRSNPDWVDIAIGANFSGIGRMGYRVLDLETMDLKDEMVLVNHYFIGNFTLDEKIKVIKNDMNETGYFGSGHCGI